MITNILIHLFLRGAASQQDYNLQGRYFHHPVQAVYYQEYDENYYGWNSQNKFVDIRKFPKRKRSKYPEYSGSSDVEYVSGKAKCRCSCNRCKDLKHCCRSICVNCNQGPGLVVVPYPLPFIVHISSTKPDSSNVRASPSATMTTTIVTTTTTTSITTSTSPMKITKHTTEPQTNPLYHNNENVKFKITPGKCPSVNKKCVNVNKIQRKSYFHDDGDKQKTINDGIVRPTLPFGNIGAKHLDSYFLPKYGIIPIPNDLAAKIMEDFNDNESVND